MVHKLAVITGASGGIGYELAIQFAKNEYDLVLVARRQQILEQFAHELQQQYKIRAFPITLDLTIPESIESLYQQLKNLNQPVDVLINNAGFGYFSFFPGIRCKKNPADAAIKHYITHSFNPLGQQGYG